MAVFLVLFVLLLSHVEAQREEDIEEWLTCEDIPGSPRSCSQPEIVYEPPINVYEAPRNVYTGRVLTSLNEYVDDEGLSVDVDVEEEQDDDIYEEYYRGSSFSLPHCPQTADEDVER